jgi:ATP synthase protein I
LNNDKIFQSAFIPSIITSAFLITILAAIRHSPGFWGAFLGAVTVIIFLSVHLVVSKISKNLDPIAVMALAMFSYFAKIALMGAFLVIVTKSTSPKSVDRASFAVTALSVTAIWLAAEIRAFLRLRPQLPLPEIKN